VNALLTVSNVIKFLLSYLQIYSFGQKHLMLVNDKHLQLIVIYLKCSSFFNSLIYNKSFITLSSGANVKSNSIIVTFRKDFQIRLIFLGVYVLNVNLLTVFMLSVIMLTVFMLSVIMLSVIMLSVIMLCVIMLSVICFV
jgi:hypothetical protein